MSKTKQAQQDYLSLRENVSSVHIATLASDQTPEVSYAPFVWHDNACYLFLSVLAKHTQNLANNPVISLMMIEDEQQSQNQFARRRIILQGKTEIIQRNSALFIAILSDFHRRFGEVMQLIEPLQDFNLFQITAESGRFIRGFGQAYELSGDKLDQLIHINPAR